MPLERLTSCDSIRPQTTQNITTSSRQTFISSQSYLIQPPVIQNQKP